MPLPVAIAVVAVVVLLIWVNIKHDTRVILQKQFPAINDPKGPLVECEIRFPMGEVSTPCVVEANRAGLYMVSTEEEIAKWSWVNNVPYLRQPVFVPWSELSYCRARFPMRDWMRFDIRGTKACFFMRMARAMELLRRGGQLHQD